MIISDIELYPIEIPSDIAPGRRSLIVRLISHAGQEGWGEAMISWRQDEIEPRRRQLLPILAGRSIFDLEELIHLEELQPKSLRFAIEMACWDMIGRLLKHPVCHFHGGEYRHQIPVVARMNGSTPEELAESALEFSHLGFHWQMVLLTGDLETDLQTIRTLKETLGNRMDLRLDLAGQYDYESCLSLFKHLEDTPATMVIDPLPPKDGFRETALLQNHTPLKIALRRSVHSAGDVFEIAKQGNIDRLVFDPQLLGSSLAIKKSAAVAEAAGIRVSLSALESTGPLLASMLQISASLPALSLGVECSPADLEKQILVDPVEIFDGLARLSHASGLSIDIDRARLEQYLIS